MKKWMYLIFPGVMLAAFLVFFTSHKAAAEVKEAKHIAQIAKDKSAAEEKKRAAEAKAREDSRKRTEERDAEDKKKEEEKTVRQAADDKKVRDATAEYTGKALVASGKVAALDAELARLRKEKDASNRAGFDFAKKVELARIARRTAELEIQRMTEMVVKRASDSSLTRPPVIPVLPPAGA
ncbi:MAG: hypothetical protein RL077_5014 [Verrucomicrobiota bacterium]|jgi:hypothetical protein